MGGINVSSLSFLGNRDLYVVSSILLFVVFKYFNTKSSHNVFNSHGIFVTHL
jgi:hypothetical protein